MRKLFALTLEAVQGLQREYWGAKIELPDGTIKDTGVQDFAEELIDRLALCANAQGTLILNKPADQAAIQINSDTGTHEGFTGDKTVVTSVTGTASASGCSVTLALVVTTETWHFEGGILTSVT